MDQLDIQLLTKLCRPGASKMNQDEIRVVQDVLIKYFLVFVDVNKIIECLLTAGYLNRHAYNIITSSTDTGHNADKSTFKTSRIKFLHLSRHIGFVALLWSLCSTGCQTVANCLLGSLHGTDAMDSIPQTVARLKPGMTNALYKLVGQLKFVSDTRLCGDPRLLLRKLAISTKAKISSEENVGRKYRLADKYFAILSIELDNFTFLKNKFVSVSALQSEVKQIIPHTSNPALSNALFLSRVAQQQYMIGHIGQADEMMQGALAIMHNTETCPEVVNIFYEHLNILLREYEKEHNAYKKAYYIGTGYEGLRIINSLSEEFRGYWLISYLQKMVLCALDIGISGTPIRTGTEPLFLQTGVDLLEEIGQHVGQFGLRRTMLYSMSKARVKHLTGDTSAAIGLLEETERMATEGEFEELRSISEFKDILKSN